MGRATEDLDVGAKLPAIDREVYVQVVIVGRDDHGRRFSNAGLFEYGQVCRASEDVLVGIANPVGQRFHDAVVDIALCEGPRSGTANAPTAQNHHGRIRYVIDAEEFVVAKHVLARPREYQHRVVVDHRLSAGRFEAPALPDADHRDAHLFAQPVLDQRFSNDRRAVRGRFGDHQVVELTDRVRYCISTHCPARK